MPRYLCKISTPNGTIIERSLTASSKVSLKEDLEIYDYWHSKLSSKGKVFRKIIRKGKAEAFFVAGKKELYQNKDSRKARQYFMQALKNNVTVKTLVFWSLSFVNVSFLLKIREDLKKLLGYW